MMFRTLTGTFFLLVPCALIGCNGPTKAGMEARSDANERLDSFHSQMAYDQARDAFKVGQFEEAQDAIAGAIERFPEKPEYYVLSGRIFLEQHRLEQAAATFSKAIEKDEELAEAHYMLGVVYQRWSNDVDAFESYTRAFELEPDNGHYLLAAAESLVAAKRYEEAKELVEPKLASFEHNAALHHLLGQVALLEGDLDAAVPWYRQARLLRPDDAMMHEELIRVFYKAERYDDCRESIVAYRMSRKADAVPMELRRLEARCLALLGRSKEALEQYLKLTREDSTNVNVWTELGALAWEMNDQRRLTMAAARLMTQAPSRFEGYLYRAISEQEKGNTDASVRFLRRAASLSDESALPHLLLGIALEQQGAQEDALIAYRSALQIEPDNADARMLFDNLGGRESAVTAVPTDR